MTVVKKNIIASTSPINFLWVSFYNDSIALHKWLELRHVLSVTTKTFYNTHTCTLTTKAHTRTHTYKHTNQQEEVIKQLLLGYSLLSVITG